MQWWLIGDVMWPALRVLALAFILSLEVGALAIDAALAVNLQPELGQEGIVLLRLIGTGLLLLVFQHLYLWLIEKSLRRGDS